MEIDLKEINWIFSLVAISVAVDDVSCYSGEHALVTPLPLNRAI